MPEERQFQPSHAIDNRFEVLERLGAGGMGEVYRARDTALDRFVAIKILPINMLGDPDRLARFQREAQILASLSHPNIAAVYSFEASRSAPVLEMELVPGPTLQERIAAGKIALDEALRIASQIADALEAAHQKGVIHRDLKPGNVKITPGGQVKVLDFGLAKALERSVPANLLTSQTATMDFTREGVIL